MFSSSVTAAHHAHNPSSVSQESARQAIDKARQAMQRDGVKAEMVSSLRADFGGDQDAFHDAILTLLDHVRQHSSLRQSLPALIEHARSQHFDLNARGTEGKTVLDVAVRHNDLKLAHYLLGKGANPERTSTAASAGMRTLLTAWRRQHLLYAHFNEGNSQGLTNVDRDLQAGYHNKIRAQLERLCRVMAEGDMQQLWEDMMDIGKHEILRALLITGTPQELRELTKQQSEVGMWQAKLRKDPGLSAVLKEFPYQSAKRGLPQNFNSKASFNTGKEILCRHLVAYQQEEQARDPHIKFNYDKFRSPTDIANNVKPDSEETWATLVGGQASETHLIDNAKFGQFLAGQFAVMEKENQPTRLMLIVATSHAMNLGLRIKDDKEGRRSYVVKFFDPNVTTTGTRSKVGNVQTLEMQTIASYLADEWRSNHHYPEARGLSMIHVRSKAEAQTSTAISAGVNVGRTLTTCIDTKDIDATAIWHLMERGFAGNLRQLPDHLKTLPEDRRIEIIAGKVANGISPLYPAMGFWQPELLQAYGDLLKLLPAGKQVELLLAKNSKGPSMGQSGLHAALTMGKFEMVKVFLNMLEELVPDLSLDQRTSLRQELRGYEARIVRCPFQSNPLSRRQYGEMTSAFSSLMSALADEGASSKET